MDVVVWLRSLGLGQYEAAFRDNEIDETVLPSLTAEDLKDFGVGHSGIAANCSTLLPRCVLIQRQAHRPPSARRVPRAPLRKTARAPPSHGDVLRLGRLNGTIGAHGP